ncbi:hypothetical protein [Acinetobacter baumannii]|uniref:hypothetical protein n=1 Tax=Acinetobacter baumannii TaxID=470 RepID=UPI000932A65E|nr:hypothetical protein [Acinetobacter baumannii]
MEFCSLDWGAIAGFAGVGATIIAARVAWNISEEWKNQKGSEVIAEEAKEVIKLLLDNIFNSTALINNVGLNSNIDQERFIFLRDQSNEIIRRTLFIDACVYIEGLRDSIDNYNRNNKVILNNLHTMIYESFTDEQFIILKVDQELRDKAHSQYCFELIKRLQPYALYRHKFIFKKVKK